MTTEPAAFEVVVVGSGAAGMTAALAAAHQGLDVVVIEKTGQFGAQYPPVQRDRLDAASLGQAARGLGVVIGVVGYPGEIDGGVRAHEPEHRRAVLEQRLLALR